MINKTTSNYLVFLLLFVICSTAVAQKNFIFIDPIKPALKSFEPNPSLAKLRILVGYERLLKDRFAAAVCLHFGQTGGTRIIETPFGKEIEIYSGMRFILQGKYYTAGKNKERFGKGLGFFFGVYGGLMTGKETSYPPLSDKQDVNGYVMGLGVHTGYKFNIKSRFYFEPQIGLPVFTVHDGFNPSNQYKREIATNLWLGNLLVGYSF